MELKICREALSKDGYIIDQGRLGDIPYGRRSTRATGCGWIACYNFLRFMGREEPPEAVRRGMERLLLWGGLLGSHPFAVWWFLHRRGFRFRLAFTGRGMERLTKGSGRTAGILTYWHGKNAHFAAFVREAKSESAPSREALRFLNAVYGIENHRLTMRDFFRKYVKFPLCIGMVAVGEGGKSRPSP